MKALLRIFHEDLCKRSWKNIAGTAINLVSSPKISRELRIY